MLKAVLGQVVLQITDLAEGGAVQGDLAVGVLGLGFRIECSFPSGGLDAGCLLVGRSFGDRASLLLLAAPGERIGAGQDELVAVLAVPAPEARPGLERGLEGREPAVGRSAVSGASARGCLRMSGADSPGSS